MTELLDLATVVERDTVRIRTKKNPEGKLYDLLNLEELGPFEHQVLLSRHAKWSALAERTDRKLTAVQQREIHKALGDILKLLLPEIEPAVLAETETPQRIRIVEAWATKNSTGAAEGEAQESQPITAGSSRGSRPSTAATRKRGSTPRRGS